jgi:hypothetical protein
MVHHYFKKYGKGEKNITIHADNCSGQNKNNAMLWYLTWRVMNEYNEKITYSFMVPGHTKFAPDGFFGLIKLRLRKSDVDDIDDLVQVVHESTRSMYNLAQPVYNNNERKVNFYQWNNFLSKYLKKLPNISKMHHFTFEKEYPGWVKYKKQHDEPDNYSCLLKNHDFRFDSIILEDELEIKEPIGLTPTRQWYLYDEIRDFVQNPIKKDIICPEPTVARP